MDIVFRAAVTWHVRTNYITAARPVFPTLVERENKQNRTAHVRCYSPTYRARQHHIELYEVLHCTRCACFDQQNKGRVKPTKKCFHIMHGKKKEKKNGNINWEAFFCFVSAYVDLFFSQYAPKWGLSIETSQRCMLTKHVCVYRNTR